MRALLRKFSLAFASGSFGGLLNSVCIWFCGQVGITAAMGVNLAPDFTAQWLYPRLVWGGIWGGLFILPLLKKSILFRGILYSIPPALVDLFVIFPRTGEGMLGSGLGRYTPLVIVLFNIVWGLAAACWFRITAEVGERRIHLE